MTDSNVAGVTARNSQIVKWQTLVKALGTDSTRRWQTWIHVSDGLAYATDGHRMHVLDVNESDGVYTVGGELVSGESANSGPSKMWQSLQGKCGSTSSVRVNSIGLWDIPRISRADVLVPLHPDVQAHEHYRYLLALPKKERDRLKYYAFGTTVRLEPVDREHCDVLDKAVWVNLDYLLDAIAHTNSVRLTFTDKYEPIFVGDNAVVMPAST